MAIPWAPLGRQHHKSRRCRVVLNSTKLPTKPQPSTYHTTNHDSSRTADLLSSPPPPFQVAARVISKRGLTTDLHRERVSRSVQLLRSLRHSHILRLVRLTETPSRVYVFSELATTDLLSLLRRQGRFTPVRTRCYLQQLLAALGYCHGRGVVHRDLKLEHVLVMPDGVLRLTGFGMASDLSPAALRETVADSPHYTAPEVITGAVAPALAPRTDVWSLGIMVYAMLCGRLPFIHAELEPLCRLVLTQDFALPDHLSPSAVHLLHYMLQKSATQRFDLAEVTIHAWTAGYDNMYPFKPVAPSVTALAPVPRADGPCPACGHAALACPAPWAELSPASDSTSAAAAVPAVTATTMAAARLAVADPRRSADLLRAVRQEMRSLGYSNADVERAALGNQPCDDATATFDLLLSKYLREGLDDLCVPDSPEAVAVAAPVSNAPAMVAEPTTPSVNDDYVERMQEHASRVRRRQMQHLAVPQSSDVTHAEPLEYTTEADAEDSLATPARSAAHTEQAATLPFFSPVAKRSVLQRFSSASPSPSEEASESSYEDAMLEVVPGMAVASEDTQKATVAHSVAEEAVDEDAPPSKRAHRASITMARRLFGRSAASLQRSLAGFEA